MICNFVFGYAGKIIYDIKIHLFKIGLKLEYKFRNVTNVWRILLKCPRTPCSNRNAADRGQGPPKLVYLSYQNVIFFYEKSDPN